MHRKHDVLIGVDFDNTIISYDDIFLETAIMYGLVPSEMPADKNNIRDFIRAKDEEDRWTLLQGEVYGKRLNDATLFPGAKDFFKFCMASGVGVCIVSHKTRTPYSGPKYDLHQAAYEWLMNMGFFDRRELGMDHDSVFFELTKADKLSRVERLGCTHYIDDLPEILSDERFPAHVEKVLFDNKDKYASTIFKRCISWREILTYFTTVI